MVVGPDVKRWTQSALKDDAGSGDMRCWWQWLKNARASTGWMSPQVCPCTVSQRVKDRLTVFLSCDFSTLRLCRKAFLEAKRNQVRVFLPRIN